MPVAEPGSTPEKKFVGDVGPASIVRLRTKTSVESFDGMPTPARPSPPAKQTRPSPPSNPPMCFGRTIQVVEKGLKGMILWFGVSKFSPII